MLQLQNTQLPCSWPAVYCPWTSTFFDAGEKYEVLNTIAQQRLHINKIKKKVQIVTFSKME